MTLDEAIKHLEEKIDDKDHEQLLGWLKELNGLRLENEVILRRLKHLLESDYISQFDQVDPNTKEYIRNIKEADWKVMYLCDQNKSCNVHCKKDHFCKRTSDISHAKNFRLISNGIYPIIYEEVDEHCIANVSFDREQLQAIIDGLMEKYGLEPKNEVKEFPCPFCGDVTYTATDYVPRFCRECGREMGFKEA